MPYIPTPFLPSTTYLIVNAVCLAVNEDLDFGSFPDLNPILTYDHYKSFFSPNT